MERLHNIIWKSKKFRRVFVNVRELIKFVRNLESFRKNCENVGERWKDYTTIYVILIGSKEFSKM